MIDSSMLLVVSEQPLVCASQLLTYALRSINLLLALIQFYPRLNAKHMDGILG